MIDSDWYAKQNGFFGQHYLEGDDSHEGYLSEKLSLEDRTHREVNGILNLLGNKENMSIMDCPCGYGILYRNGQRI